MALEKDQGVKWLQWWRRMRVDRIAVLYRRHRGGPHVDEEELVDDYMERKCSRENPFTAADKDEIASNIEYILEANGYSTQGVHDEAVAALHHLCEVWMRISIERTSRGMKGLVEHERDLVCQGGPRRELNQVEMAALCLVAEDWVRATAARSTPET